MNGAMTPMSAARAMAAGILLTVLVIDIVPDSDISDSDITVWLAVLGVIVLLIIPDFIYKWQHRKDKERDV